MPYKEFICSKEQINITIESMNDANFTQKFESKRIAIHWVQLFPNQRSSIPHAESLEEEVVYIVSGLPHAWINGYIYQLEANIVVGFPAGTGVLHTFINNTAEIVEMVVIGERSKVDNKYIYPLNLELYEQHKSHWWNDWPQQDIGPHRAQVGDLSHQKEWHESPFVKKIGEINRGPSFSYPGDNETFSCGIRLSDFLNLKAVGLWHEVMATAKRSSWPHAHSIEEEFAVLLKGQAKVWLNGYIYDLKPGDCVYFKPGTNVAHTLSNESGSDVEFLGIGQADGGGPNDCIYYPLHADRNLYCQEHGYLWMDPPVATLGKHKGLPRADHFHVKKIKNVDEFLQLLMPMLLQNEAEYSLMLGLAHNNLKLTSQSDQSVYFAVCEGDILIGGGLLSTKDLIVTRIPGPALPSLAQYLIENKITIPGIVGPSATSETFAHILQDLDQTDCKMAMAQKIYKIEEVLMPQINSGQIVHAQEEHAEFVGRWLFEFCSESLPHEKNTLENCMAMAVKKIKNGDAYLWQNNAEQIVSMNMTGRPTHNGICISGVYTPKHFRNKGYASALVAVTSDLMLKNGRKFCVLYTDLANPTSNKIYQKIGYKEIASSKYFIFK